MSSGGHQLSLSLASFLDPRGLVWPDDGADPVDEEEGVAVVPEDEEEASALSFSDPTISDSPSTY